MINSVQLNGFAGRLARADEVVPLGARVAAGALSLEALEPGGLPAAEDSAGPLLDLQTRLLAQYMFIQKMQEDIGEIFSDPEGKDKEW